MLVHSNLVIVGILLSYAVGDDGPDFAPVYLTLSSLFREAKHSTQLIDREVQVHWEKGAVDKISLYDHPPSPNAQPILQFNTLMYPDCFAETNISLGNPELPGGWVRESEHKGEPGEHCLPMWLVAYKDGEVTFTDCLKIRPTWIQDNRLSLEMMNLSSVLLPGTHNSGSYRRGESLSQRDTSGRYIITQDTSIWDQLVFGIRYLDLRIGYYPNKRHQAHTYDCFWINHDLIKVRPLKPLLDDLKSFLERTKDEIVVLDFHRFPLGFHGRTSRHHLLIELLEEELKDYAFFYQNDTVPTFGEIWDQGKRLIISYGEASIAKEYDWLWPPFRQAWGNRQTVESLYNFLDNVMTNRTIPGLWAAMAQLTPAPLDLLLNPKGSLRHMAHGVNANLTDWVREGWWQTANIIATDFFLGTDLINTAVAVNAYKGNVDKHYFID